ncbi:MAG: S-layer homology domain-containing protein [Clostridia bacterium]|nr:S-layer homology domain-containing protein [Clostridia bacterium]
MTNSKRIMAMLFAVIISAFAIVSAVAFTDVKVDDDAFEAISTLNALGVIHGKTETEYAPDDLVTREEMAALVYRLYTTQSHEHGQNYTPFIDLTDPFYNTMISWCFDQGVVNGTTPTTFEPKENISYQDALTMATRLLGYKDLSYPLGYISKARIIGLTKGLESISFDKLLTRAEIAQILYNALEAPSAQEVKETTIYEGFPITTTRPFTIAEDIYSFKKTTYQIVGTENFNLEGYRKSGYENGYYLAAVDAKGNVSSSAVYYDFDDLGISEEVNSDDNILGYLRVMSRGEIGEKGSIVLGSVIISDLDSKAEIEIVYDQPDKSSTKLVKNPDFISVDGKDTDIHQILYTVSAGGVISPLSEELDLSEAHPVFYSENGKYVHKSIDFDNDKKHDAIMIFEMAFKQIKDISSKDKYTFINPVTSSSDPAVDIDDIIFNTEVEKKDYVLVYDYGKFTVIEETVEPEITSIIGKKGSGSSIKYTLGNGSVVGYATKNNPVTNIDNTGKSLSIENEEKAVYIVNDMILYVSGADSIGYTPYTYAFIISEADEETSVDPETGAIETVKNFIGLINGKAVTLPIYEDYNISNYEKKLVTVTGVKNGKYLLSPEILVKDAEYEQKVSGTLTYDQYTGLYKINGKYFNLDSNSEIYVTKYSEEGEYESVKRYTSSNMPANASGTVQTAIIRKNDNSSVYTMVVAYLKDSKDFAGTTEYTGNRLVLSHGSKLEDGKNHNVYEVLNMFTGKIETIVDALDSESAGDYFEVGSIIRQAPNGTISLVSGADDKFSSLNDNTVTGIATIGENGVYNDNVVFIDGAERSVVIGGISIYKLTIDENKEFIVEEVDAQELQGQTIRTHTSASNNYKMSYAIILPEEWVETEA